MAIEPSPELERISHRLAAEKGLDDLGRLGLVQAYLDFLQGAAGSGKPVFPTHAVDEIWHRHILDTQSYARDCGRWFGRFIHHQPDTVPDEASGPGGALADCGAQDPVPCTGLGAAWADCSAQGPPRSSRIAAAPADCSAPNPDPPCRAIAAAVR